jgi:hypothetical protein
LDKSEKLEERAGNREDIYLQSITKARNAAELTGDQETGLKIDKIYDEVTYKILDIDKERRQKVLDSQIGALEQEIEVYSEAIEKVKKLVV